MKNYAISNILSVIAFLKVLLSIIPFSDLSLTLGILQVHDPASYQGYSRYLAGSSLV